MKVRLAAIAVVALVFAAGCEETLDTERRVPERGTLGQEVFALIRKDIARAEREGDARRNALDAQSLGIINAIDGTIPLSFRGTMDIFLTQVVEDGVYDDGVMAGATRAAAAELRNLTLEPLLLASWSRSAHRGGRLPRETRLLEHLVNFPQLQALTRELGDYAQARDGLADDGADAPGEPTVFADGIDALGRALQSVDPGDDPEERIMAEVADWLVTESPELESDPQPFHIVRRDRRGAPVVTTDDQGVPRAPFLDGDGDGLADVDANGRFLRESAPPFFIPPHVSRLSNQHDGFGRALLPAGDGETLAYRYSDLHQTVLRALLGDVHELLTAELPFDVLEVAPVVIAAGRRTQRTDPDGIYDAFDIESGSPLLEAFNALMLLLDTQELPAFLEATSLILGDPNVNLAGVVAVLQQLDEIAERHPNAQLSETSIFFEALLDFFAEVVVVPGLLSELLGEAENIDVDLLNDSAAALMNFGDAHITEAEADTCLTGAFCQPLAEPVDRARPDLETDSGDPPNRVSNRSIFQRALHLVADASERPYALAPFGEEPAIFQTDDIAAFYFDVIGGLSRDEFETYGDLACIDEFLRTIIDRGLGVDIDRCPTAEQAGRFMNQELFDALEDQELVCSEGYVIRNHHGDTLYGFVITEGTEALKPIARAFSRQGQSAILGRLLALLHRHWASPQAVYLQADGSDSEQFGSNVVSYEPMLIELLTQSDFTRELVRAMAALSRLRLSDGRPVGDVLEVMLQHLLVPNGAIARRDGTRTWTLPDGSTRDIMSRFQLLRLALDELDAAVSSDPAADAAWDRIVDTVDDHFLDTELGAGSDGFVFRLNHIPLAGAFLAAQLVDDAARRVEAGDLNDLLLEEWPNAWAETLSGRNLAAAADLATDLNQAGGLRTLLLDLALHFLGPNVAEETLDDVAIVLLDLVFDALEHDPRPDSADARGYVGAATAYGRMLSYAPSGNRLPFHVIRLLRRLVTVDGPADRLGNLLRNTIRPSGTQPEDPYQLFVLGRALMRDQRVDPRIATAPPSELTPADYTQILEGIADYLLDERKGAERLYRIIADRL